MFSPSHVLGMSPKGGPSSVRSAFRGLLNASEPGRLETSSKI